MLVNHRQVIGEIMRRSRHLASAKAAGRERGVILTSGDLAIGVTCATLFRPVTGWAWQQPDLGGLLVADARPIPGLADDPRVAALLGPAGVGEIMPASLVERARRDWHGACAEASRAYARLVVDLGRLIVPGGDPFEPIQPIIDTPNPLATFLRLVDKAEGRLPDRRLDARDWRQGVRSLVLIRILESTFLRSRNLRSLTYRDDQTGSLRYVGGVWEIHILWQQFKNAKSKDLFAPIGSRMDYRKRIPNTNGPYALLDLYVREVLPVLRAAWPGSDFLFPSEVHPMLNAQSLHGVIYRFTRDHCAWNLYNATGMPDVSPFGGHAVRDLGATTILKGETQVDRVRAAADLLQTSPEMIMHRYGKLSVVKRLSAIDSALVAASDLAAGSDPLW